MKKLNKLVFTKAKILSAPEMKHITGGYDGSGGEECTNFDCVCNPDGSLYDVFSKFSMCVKFVETIDAMLRIRCYSSGGSCKQAYN